MKKQLISSKKSKSRSFFSQSGNSWFPGSRTIPYFFFIPNSPFCYSCRFSRKAKIGRNSPCPIKKNSEQKLWVFIGADKRIRTSMKLPSHGPEPCASANSAISARFLFSLTRLFHYTSFCDFCKLFLKLFLIFFDLFFAVFWTPLFCKALGEFA